MAKINNTTDYANTVAALADHVIGTDVSNTTNDPNGETVTFTIQALLDAANLLTAKTTPVGADTLLLNDSAASNVAKEVTYANLQLGIKLATRSTYGGTANAITLTTGLSLSALTTGMKVRFRATSANTGATTINLDGIGTTNCRTIDESTALPSGYIRTDVDTEAYYNGTNWVVDRQPEVGSNSNGNYLRLANGFQQCDTLSSIALNIQQAVLGGFRNTTGGTTWTYPVAFNAAPVVQATPTEVDSGIGASAVTTTSTTTLLCFYAVTSQASITRTAYRSATGTWY